MSIVGVAPTRPDTLMRSKRGSTVDCVAASVVNVGSAGAVGLRAHHARTPPAPMSTIARITRRKIDARDGPRERSARAAALWEEPFERRAPDEPGVEDAWLMQEW